MAVVLLECGALVFTVSLSSPSAIHRPLLYILYIASTCGLYREYSTLHALLECVYAHCTARGGSVLGRRAERDRQGHCHVVQANPIAGQLRESQ